MPVVGLVTDRRTVDGMAVHQANDEYIAAIRDGAGALPLLIPSTDMALDPCAILDAVDGLLFTGSASNVAPSHYAGTARPGTLFDPARDAASLPLVRAAIARGRPLLAICRGFQELNVALGGSLHQHVHELPDHLDHRELRNAPSVDAEYAPAHDIAIAPGGLLARLGGMTQARVNSLHHQGIDRLAQGLAVEATAPDGLVEAVSLPGAKAFVLGVQWHLEWRWAENALSRAVLAGFATALDASQSFTTP
jgi:putative glutamine amidotransferase